jgi:hypothetical protein
VAVKVAVNGFEQAKWLQHGLLKISYQKLILRNKLGTINVEMYIYSIVCPWKVPKWPWFWAEMAVKARRDLATLIKTVVNVDLKISNTLSGHV